MSFTNYSHRNSKLESFLQRTLSEEEFSRVRAYASCVVHSDIERLTFRRAVLTDDAVYLTEYPPRSLYVATKIADVLDVSVINDDPWFLGGEDRKNCQHVQLTCKAPSSILRRTWRSGRLSVSELDVPAKVNAATSPRIWRRIVKSFQGPSSRRGSTETAPNEDDTISEEATIPTNSIPFMPNNKSPNSSSFIFPKELRAGDNTEIEITTQTSGHNNSLASLGSGYSQDSGISESDVFDDNRSVFSSLETWPKATGQKFFQLKSHSALDYYKPSIDKSLTPLPERSKSTSDAITIPKRRIEVKELPKASSFEKEPQKSHLINFYILDPNSGFTSNLLMVRDNYLIHSTLVLEEDSIERKCNKNIKTEVVEKLLRDLKEELIASINNIEKTFNLLQELKTAAKKYFVLRLLFWKDSSFPKLLVYLMKRYFSHLQDVGNDFHALSACEDELHISVLILETFNIMLRETETCVSRWQYLTANKNKAFSNIVNIVVAGPTVPKQFLNTTNRMLTSFDEFKSKAWENLPESEIIKLLVEIIINRLGLLFELMFSCKQAEMLSTFSIYDVSSVIANNPFAETFIAEIMTQCLALLSSDNNEILHATETITLYKHLYVLKTVTLCNSRLDGIITEKYGEEFRYYVHPNVVASKIPNLFPIKNLLIKLLQEVASRLKTHQTVKNSWH